MRLPSIKISFGKQVRKYRAKRHLSQERLAEICDMHVSYIGRIERGIQNVRLENIQIIASALKVRPRDLLP